MKSLEQLRKLNDEAAAKELARQGKKLSDFPWPHDTNEKGKQDEAGKPGDRTKQAA